MSVYLELRLYRYVIGVCKVTACVYTLDTSLLGSVAGGGTVRRTDGQH